MAKLELKMRALEMRKQEMSYSQIKRELQVSKSSLSLWLKGMPLSKERIRELRDRNERRIERYRQTRLTIRQARLDAVYLQEKEFWLPLSKKELLLAGLFLYWGEGLKAGSSTVAISNTDPEVLKFTVQWLVNGLGVDKAKLVAKLHIYQDMNEEEMIYYWMNELGIKRSQFRKTYVKKTTLSGLTYKGFGHGTCNLQFESVPLKEKILMGIKAIADSF